MNDFDHYFGTAEDEHYKGHTLRAIARQPAKDSRWTVEVHIRRDADGQSLPSVASYNHTYGTAAEALQAGRARAREVIDSDA